MNFFGQSFKFPLNLIGGKLVRVSDEKFMEQRFKKYFESPIGSARYNPEFGSRINEILGENNDDIFNSLLSQFIFDIGEKFSEISIQDVIIDNKEETAYIMVIYNRNRDNILGNFNLSLERG